MRHKCREGGPAAEVKHAVRRLTEVKRLSPSARYSSAPVVADRLGAVESRLSARDAKKSSFLMLKM